MGIPWDGMGWDRKICPMDKSGYWLRWFFKRSRLPTPGVLAKHIIIGAQDLGSDPRAGQIRHSVANSSLPSLRGFLGVEAVVHDR